jgi:hypothetical protein
MALELTGEKPLFIDIFNGLGDLSEKDSTYAGNRRTII